MARGRGPGRGPSVGLLRADRPDDTRPRLGPHRAELADGGAALAWTRFHCGPIHCHGAQDTTRDVSNGVDTADIAVTGWNRFHEGD